MLGVAGGTATKVSKFRSVHSSDDAVFSAGSRGDVAGAVRSSLGYIFSCHIAARIWKDVFWRRRRP